MELTFTLRRFHLMLTWNWQPWECHGPSSPCCIFWFAGGPIECGLLKAED